MAAPTVVQRGTGDRGISSCGAGRDAAPRAKAPAKTPTRTPVQTPAPIGSCLEFITVNEERSNTRTGTGVHRAIREQIVPYLREQGYGSPLKIKLPDGSFDHYRDRNNFLIGGGELKGSGDVDIAVRSRSGAVMLVAEIKPANLEALTGETQLANYIDKANANEDFKRQWNVLVFSPMKPVEATLPPEVIYQSRRFEIRWCGPGIILYKEIKKKEGEEDKEKQEKERPKSVEELTAEGKPWLEYVKPIYSAPRPMKFEAWVPKALRNDILANNIPEGVYRNRYQAVWPSGYTSNVVLWVQTGPFGREYQYYQESPTDLGFYEYLAQKKGLSQWQRELVRSTLIEYDNALWSMISPNRSPYYARDELRTIYAEILKAVVGGSAAIVASGAGITGIANGMRQRATQGRALQGRSLGKEQAPGTRDEFPDLLREVIIKDGKAVSNDNVEAPILPSFREAG